VNDLEDVLQVLSVAAFALLVRAPAEASTGPDRTQALRWVHDLDRERRNSAVARAEGQLLEACNALT